MFDQRLRMETWGKQEGAGLRLVGRVEGQERGGSVVLVVVVVFFL